MTTGYYLSLASSGLRMPIGTDLILNEHHDAADLVVDGARLGQVVIETARRFHTPLAIPLMDLRLEKADLLSRLGIDGLDADTFHFDEPPDQAAFHKWEYAPWSQRHQASFEAIRMVSAEGGLLPIGMAIGPFSLMTKLMADPITAVAMAGMGVCAKEDPGVDLMETCLRLAERAVLRSIRAQIEAGARACIICEPAANSAYISPKMLKAGSDIFERYVLAPNIRVRVLMSEMNADLFFHNCGELTTDMVRRISLALSPSILSLGSSRKLWEDAAVVPKHIVLFGNLPTKSFYSDEVMPLVEVGRRTLELISRMHDAAHPHILGSECDVLHVPEAAETIRNKVRHMLECH